MDLTRRFPRTQKIRVSQQPAFRDWSTGKNPRDRMVYLLNRGLDHEGQILEDQVDVALDDEADRQVTDVFYCGVC